HIQPLAGGATQADGIAAAAGRVEGGVEHQLGRGVHCSFSLRSSPMRPLGRNRVAIMNSAPRANSQYSGKATVNQLFMPLTRPAPSSGPISVPRPPRATQMAASMELVGDISLGLMMPTCGTYSAPARPHNTAEITQINSL